MAKHKKKKHKRRIKVTTEPDMQPTLEQIAEDMEKYTYFEIEFKEPADKEWSHLKISHDWKEAVSFFERLRKMGHRSRLIRVDVEKKIAARG